MRGQLIHTEVKSSPLFRWVGGKQRLVQRLVSFLPDDMKSRRYVEPFFGAGSLFFAVNPRRATIGDANTDLIACYEHVRDNPETVARYLSSLAKRNTSESYYEIRSKYNSVGWSYRKAAYFIYLNKTSFNGIYRVNQNNMYNVPYGKKLNPNFPSLSDLRAVSNALMGVKIVQGTYAKTLHKITRKSFVYLDPPYPALNGTAFFAHYTDDRFLEDDQCELADLVHRLHKSGILFMMSNAATPLIAELFSKYRIDSLNVPRWVSCKGKKLRVDELVIRNY